VDHGADSCLPEGTGDASPWLNPRCVVSFASDCGFAPKKYIARKIQIFQPVEERVESKG
jgi:hypothetical protein